MTANKKYFANYKRFSAPINISLAEKGLTLAYGSGRVNVVMQLQGRIAQLLIVNPHAIHFYWRRG